MSTPSFNRFSVLNNLSDGNKPIKGTVSSPPSKKCKKKVSPSSGSPGNKNAGNLEVVTKENRDKPKNRSDSRIKANSKGRSDRKDSGHKPNRRLVLSDSDSEKELSTNEICGSEKELACDSPAKVESPLDPTPPEVRQNICPATKYYVVLARQHHTIPTMAQLLDRAGAFGRMFENGKPMNCLASDIVNLDEIYGMYRERFQERKVMWEEKASIIFFEQGLIQQVFEKGKIVLFFDLIKKHRDSVPNLFRMYNAVYDLDGETEAE